MRASVLGLVLLVLGHAGAAARERGGFEPERFFAGRTRSVGTMASPFDGSRTGVTGDTRGRRERDGSVVFDQRIRFDDGSVRERRWRVVRTGPDTIAATGTDVVGIATGTINGREVRLLSTIRASADNPLTDVDFDQTMTLSPDGRTLHVASTVRKLGFTVRTIDERFTRVDGPVRAR